MSCVSIEILIDFADGRLDRESAARVERHISRCASCRRTLSEAGRAANDDETLPPRSVTRPAPRRFGRYELKSRIGRGGMGEVYRARDVALRREVALKILRDARGADSERIRARFEKEARTVATVNHPNIVTIYDVGFEGDAPYIVNELLEGVTLREKLRGGALGVATAVEYGMQISRGLAAAHDQGIVHRDLKPANLFLTTKDQIKVLDFGLAKLDRDRASIATASDAPPAPIPFGTPEAEGPATEPGMILGTVGYMSPEQARALPIDHRSDLFSLGVIMLELITGTRPFKRATEKEALAAIIGADPFAGVEGRLPPALERILRRCLQKKPQERFQSAHDLLFALETFALESFAVETSARETFARETSAREPAARERERPSAPLLPAMPARTRRSRTRAARMLAAVVAMFAIAAAAGVAARESPEVGPTYRRLMYRRGMVTAARIGPDSQTVVFGAAFESNTPELYAARVGSAEFRPLHLGPANILAISAGGEMAILTKPRSCHVYVTWCGTLARVPLAGGAPRELAENVESADWTPAGELAVIRAEKERAVLELPLGVVRHESSGWLSNVRVSSSGVIAFVEHAGEGDDGGAVMVIDGSGGLRRLAGDFSSIFGLAWSARSDEVWVSGTRGGSSSVYGVALDGRVRVVLETIGRTAIHDVARDGTAILEKIDKRTGIIARRPGAAEERELSWFDRSLATDITADGSSVLFVEAGEGASYVAYLRKTDGSDAMRLGEARFTQLSPDGERVLALSHRQRLLVYPVGLGEARELEPGPIEQYLRLAWRPDGRSILFVGREQGAKEKKLYEQLIAGGPPRALASWPGTTASFHVAPDGDRISFATADGRPAIFSITRGKYRLVEGLGRDTSILGWSDDGLSWFVRRPGELPAAIYRQPIDGGPSELLWKLIPGDPSGILAMTTARLTPDGRGYVYTYARVLSELYSARGLE